MMQKNVKELLDKISRMIDTSDEQHKDCVERYISLVNRRLHKETDMDAFHGIYGASAVLQRKWEDKFGMFTPRDKPVVDTINLYCK